jgi:hypothetical protein
MKFVLALIASCFSLITWSQEVGHACSEAKTYAKHRGVKTLTAQEEVKANAYDVHFYNLDLNMTNQSTLLSVKAQIMECSSLKSPLKTLRELNVVSFHFKAGKF